MHCCNGFALYKTALQLQQSIAGVTVPLELLGLKVKAEYVYNRPTGDGLQGRDKPSMLHVLIKTVVTLNLDSDNTF